MKIEDAYNSIAKEGLSVFGGEQWDTIVINHHIGEKMVRSTVSKTFEGESFRTNKRVPFQVAMEATKASIILRDNLLKATGERIWGLTMTIDKNGTFNIEYSYDKPDGY